MNGALLILLGALTATGIALKLLHRPESDEAGNEPQEGDDSSSGEACCGMHITCEKDSLVAGAFDDERYYDDEELDAFAGRGADTYTEQETEMFRDVLLTLRPDEIAGWARSVQQRGITLPAEVRDELIMIVAEAREAALTTTRND